LTGLPHPSGVRGFKSHLPHLQILHDDSIADLRYVNDLNHIYLEYIESRF
jgi:hypothetical protein